MEKAYFTIHIVGHQIHKRDNVAVGTMPRARHRSSAVSSWRLYPPPPRASSPPPSLIAVTEPRRRWIGFPAGDGRLLVVGTEGRSQHVPESVQESARSPRGFQLRGGAVGIWPQPPPHPWPEPLPLEQRETLGTSPGGEHSESVPPHPDPTPPPPPAPSTPIDHSQSVILF